MITVNDNLIPQDLVERLHKKYTNGKFRFYWKGNVKQSMCHWHIDICDISPTNRTDLTERFYNSNGRFDDEIAVWKIIKEQVLGNFSLHRVYVNGYTFGTEGALHTDTDVDGDETAILYLNKDWKLEWAGETVIFKDDDIERSVLPKAGRVLTFPSNQLHCARSVSKTCDELRMVLVFKGCRIE